MRKPGNSLTPQEQQYIDECVAEQRRYGSKQTDAQLRAGIEFSMHTRRLVQICYEAGDKDQARRIERRHLARRAWIVDRMMDGKEDNK